MTPTRERAFFILDLMNIAFRVAGEGESFEGESFEDVVCDYGRAAKVTHEDVESIKKMTVAQILALPPEAKL